MICRNFSQFDEWKPARLVWDAPEEAPAPAAGEAPPPAEAKPEQSPADTAAAAAAQAEQGATRREAVAAGQPNPAEAEAVLAALGVEVKVAPKSGEPLTLEKIGEALAKAQPEQILTLQAALDDAVTDKEKEDLQKKFNANGLLDWKGVVQAIAEGKLSVRELVVVSALLEENPTAITAQGVDKASVEQASQRIKTLKQALEKQLNPQYAADQVDALFRKPEYQDAYEAFIKDQDQAKFLAKIPNEEDRKIIEWAIKTPPTIAEKTAVGKEFESLIAKKDTAAIGEAVIARTMNYREGMAAKALLDDLQRVAESQDKIPDELKGLGFMGLLEKLIEKLTKLMEKLTGQLDKAFAKKSDQFDTSPIGGDQKYTLEKPGTGEQGINLRAEKSGQEVKAVTGGKVAEVGPNYVKVQVGKGFVIYGGLIPAVKKDEEITKGAKLGVMQNDLLNFQMVGEDGKQIDPTKMLGNEKFLKPAEKKAEAPELKVTQWPIALAGDAKLNITKDFTQTGSKGVEITAAKDTSVMMMADGIITKSENGTVEVTYKYGKVMKFTGLKNDTSLHAANANEVIKAGVAIGAVGDTGILGIQVIENGTQIDPASPFLANYLPAAPAPAPAAAQNAPAAGQPQTKT